MWASRGNEICLLEKSFLTTNIIFSFLTKQALLIIVSVFMTSIQIHHFAAFYSDPSFCCIKKNIQFRIGKSYKKIMVNYCTHLHAIVCSQICNCSLIWTIVVWFEKGEQVDFILTYNYIKLNIKLQFCSIES